MAFDSFEAFIAMEGHGPYVWACYLVFFVLSLVFIAWSKRQRRVALDGLARRQTPVTRTAPGSAGADFARVGSPGTTENLQTTDGRQNASDS
jgi:heme exporter protein D